MRPQRGNNRSLKGNIMATVLIGCRLPSGIILQHPTNSNQRVKLSGTYETKMESGLFIPPRAYSTTQVDAEFWATWKAAYAGFPPLKTRAIFEAKTDQEAGAKVKDTARTGFEPMSKNAVIDGTRLEQGNS